MSAIILQHNVSEEDIRRGKTEQKVKDVIYDLACVAHQHLETVSNPKQYGKCPKISNILLFLFSNLLVIRGFIHIMPVDYLICMVTLKYACAAI